MEALIALIFSLVVLFAASFFLRSVIWHLRHPFLWLNHALWLIHDPFRWGFRQTKNAKGRVAHVSMFFGLIPRIWYLGMHIITTPLRFINTLYFTVLLFWSTALYDNLADLFNPKDRASQSKKGCSYLLAFTLGFPIRFFQAVIRSSVVVGSTILMVAVEVILPVYTMLHGTTFRYAGTDITTEGRWKTGGGDYAGSGIYFTFSRRTAEHYADNRDAAIVLSRVCLFPCRNSATMKSEQRELIGYNGQKLSETAGAFTRSIEHWRGAGANWWEYCLIQPGRAGKKITSWRTRPIAMERNGKLSRVWEGGVKPTIGGGKGVLVGVICWFILILFLGGESN